MVEMIRAIAVLVMCGVMGGSLCTPLVAQEARNRAHKLEKDGNYAEAFELYKSFLEDEEYFGKDSPEDLRRGTECLTQLQRISEQDEFVESALVKQPKNAELFRAAARFYRNANHWGFLVGGEFKRGHHRGGGEQVTAFARDRVRALQLMVEAMEMASAKQLGGYFFEEFAGMMLQSERGGPWRLGILTDLETLPDYEPANTWYGYHRGDRGAPVDENGDPIYYSIPGSWEEVRNDGERWRWLLEEAARVDSRYRYSVDLQFAGALEGTLASEWLSPHDEEAYADL